MPRIIQFLIVVDVLCLSYGDPFSNSCGKSLMSAQPDWRVVGGTDAAVGEFPWHIILTFAEDNNFFPDANNFCGGTIINERWVLTAGHCVHFRIGSNLKVRLGVHNFKINEKGKEVDILVEKIIAHEHLVIVKSVAQSNDIALIKLKESLDFNGAHKHLSPVCLARSDSKLTDKCVASGFGYINKLGQRPKNGVLQKVDEPITNTTLCEKYFPHFNETMNLCAGGLQAGGKGVCQGDSGGPLQCLSEDGRWHQVGLVSYGKPCALPHIPDVFTRVSSYVDWIERTVSTH